MRFVCADGDEAARSLLDPEPARAAGHELVWHDGSPADRDEWIRRRDGADGVMLMWGIPRGVLSGVPSVRVVSFAGSGAGSYVPLDEAARCGVTVCNVQSYGATRSPSTPLRSPSPSRGACARATRSSRAGAGVQARSAGSSSAVAASASSLVPSACRRKQRSLFAGLSLFPHHQNV